MDRNQREIEQIAEYADSRVRAILPQPAPAPKDAGTPAPRRGSLPAIPVRRGLAEALYRKWGNRGNAVYTALGSLITMMLVAGLAWGFDEPFLFPSLGATAFLMFETPMAEVSSPRNTIIGHYVGAAVAFFWLWVFGLLDQPTAIDAGFGAERWAAVALALAATGLLLRLLRAAHPPAGATTIIVALGLLDTGHQMFILALGVLIVAIPAGILNRLFGVPAPLWVGPYQQGTVRKLLRLGPKQRPPEPAAGALGPLASIFDPGGYATPRQAEPARPADATQVRPVPPPPDDATQVRPVPPPPGDATQARPVPPQGGGPPKQTRRRPPTP